MCRWVNSVRGTRTVSCYEMKKGAVAFAGTSHNSCDYQSQRLYVLVQACRFSKFCRLCPRKHLSYSYWRMKKIRATKLNTPAVSEHRSFRRFVKRVFASFIKHQSGTQNGFRKIVLEKLQGLEDSIEIIAREMARQARRRLE